MATAEEVLIELRQHGAQQVAGDLERVGTAGRTMGRGVESGANAGTAAIAGLTKVLAPLMAVLGALKVAETALTFNNMRQQSEMAFEVMLGSAEAAKRMMQDIIDFAATTPFEVKGLTQSTQKLAAFGFAAKDLLPIMQTLGDAMAGTGMGAEGLDRATRALGQMATRGKVATQEMNQLTELGIPAWQALANAIGVDTTEAMAMVEAGAVDAATGINAVLDLMDERFGGLMEKQSHTLGGLASTIKDTFAQTIGTIAEPAVNRLTDAMERLVSFTKTDQFSGFVENAKNAFEGLFQLLERNPLAGGEGWTGVDIATMVEGWASSFAEWVPKAMTEMGTRLDELLSGLGQWITDNGPWLQERITGVWVPAAVEWVLTAAGQIAGNLAHVTYEVAKWVGEKGYPAMLKFGSDLGMGFVQGFMSGAANIKDQIAQWWDDITSMRRGMTDEAYREWAKGFQLEQAYESGQLARPEPPEIPPPPEPPAAMAEPERLTRGYIEVPGSRADVKEPKATKERAEREAQTAIMGFMEALAASRADMMAQFGQLGADGASALANAIAQNTAASGGAVARAMESLLIQAQEAGIENWRELGDRLAEAFHDALTSGSAEAQQQALTMLTSVTAEIAGARAATAINEATDKAADAIGEAQDRARDQIDRLVEAYDASDEIRREMDRMNEELRRGLERMQSTQQRITDNITAGRSARDLGRQYGREDLLTGEQREQSRADLERNQGRRLADLQRNYAQRVADIQRRGGPNAPQAMQDAARDYQQQVAEATRQAAEQRADLEERIKLEDQNRARQRQWAAEDQAQRMADVMADKERAARNQAALELERQRLQAPIDRLELEQREKGLAQQIADIRKNEYDTILRINEQLAETNRLEQQRVDRALGASGSTDASAEPPAGVGAGAGLHETVEVEDVNMDGERVGTITFRHQTNRIATRASVMGGA